MGRTAACPVRLGHSALMAASQWTRTSSCQWAESTGRPDRPLPVAERLQSWPSVACFARHAEHDGPAAVLSPRPSAPGGSSMGPATGRFLGLPPAKPAPARRRRPSQQGVLATGGVQGRGRRRQFWAARPERRRTLRGHGVAQGPGGRRATGARSLSGGLSARLMSRARGTGAHRTLLQRAPPPPATAA